MRVITTNQAEGLFWEEKTVEKSEIGCMNLIQVYPECEKQTMKGFGGAFTEAAAYTYSKLSEDAKKEFVKAYFGKDGLSYNLARTHMNSCDFALSNYAAVTDENDTEFKTFTFEREEKYLFKLIDDAKAYIKENGGDDIIFLLSPWSPPAFMKTNGEMNNGGKLKEEHHNTWARYTAKYIKELRARGIQVTYLTVQNEPEATQTWDSCRYSATEEKDYVKNHLSKVLKEEGLADIKILVWDHNKEIVYDRAKEIFSDKEAADEIYGVGIHWYTGDHFEGLSLVKEMYPDKEIFFTEGCVEYSRFADSNEAAKAEMYAHDMIGNFNHGVSAFFDWNLLLDAKGGPNHVGNFCAAPIMATEDELNFEKRLSYYYIGHFSRFVKAGAKRIVLTKFSDVVDAVGFKNEDGERVIILMNKSDKVTEVTVGEQGKGTDLVLKPHTIVTLCY